MNKIKFLGVLIFIVSIMLGILFNFVNTQNKDNNNLIKTINQQKAFTQEISKNIFYISRHKDASTEQLNSSIKQFLSNMDRREDNLHNIHSIEIKEQSAKIMKLWNEFYILVQKFKDQKNVTTTYSNILLEKTVIEIYNKNLILVVEFDKLLKISKKHLGKELEMYKDIEYTLFGILTLLLLYLFTQLQSVLNFVNKFRSTSKNIIDNSSIKELEPIEHNGATGDISHVTENFNKLVQNINESINYSSEYIEHSYKSLEVVEDKIEDLMELIHTMEETQNSDNNLTKKEDAIIQSLEELTISAQNLKNLQKDLKNLTAHYEQ